MTSDSSRTALDKAAILVEALPYIRSYRGHTVVVKIGGQALDDPATASLVAEDLALLAMVGIRLVVVHGGGPQVTAAMNEAGITPEFVGGLRVTGDAAMEIVSRVLVGSINTDLVSRLCGAGIAAVGVSGADAGLLEADLARSPDGADLGRVGSVSSVNSELLELLLEGGFTPVIASIATESDGGRLNVNADEVAGAVAGSLHAAKVVYLTNVAGLYADLGDEGSLVSELKASDLTDMLPKLSEGMQPKAKSALHALESGVGKAHILDGRITHAILLEVFTAEGIGTQVLP